MISAWLLSLCHLRISSLPSALQLPHGLLPILCGLSRAASHVLAGGQAVSSSSGLDPILLSGL